MAERTIPYARAVSIFHLGDKVKEGLRSDIEERDKVIKALRAEANFVGHIPPAEPNAMKQLNELRHRIDTHAPTTANIDSLKTFAKEAREKAKRTNAKGTEVAKRVRGRFQAAAAAERQVAKLANGGATEMKKSRAGKKRVLKELTKKTK
jgi:hypothetical protein